ncbi:hypothetical protein HNW13_018070 [Shewanella sp. BF02_Schw]|uniref:hypothetical protein n=1 Tax=Shewanella sp. BF02_Schw TaxID=394908 RepID=UPI00177CF223|nr:hypothetical protein [Shewanella sp. BF02_Schw]MBO1897647.1 hypothetical protein [Shewanella sp. BF02_Schw]
MGMAKQVVRFSSRDYDPKQIKFLSKQWGEFVYRSPLGICFADERFLATQEYLIKKHKIKNGYLIIQTGQNSFEFNRVTGSFIDEAQTYLTESESLENTLKARLPIDRTLLKIVIRCEKSLEVNTDGFDIILDTDDEEVPEKFEYTLASIAEKQSFGKTKEIVVVAVFLVAIGVYFFPQIFEEEEVVVQQDIVNPDKEFIKTLNGGEADVRHTLLAAHKLITILDKLPQWHYTQINFTRSAGSMIIAAEVIPKEEGDKPLKIMLIDAMGRDGYSIDLQQQNPVIFTNEQNRPVFNQRYESASLVNIDQAIAYLSDSVGTLVENGSLQVASTQVTQVSNKYKQKDIQLVLGGNYIQHLDFLSIIFSGWPVVLQSGRIENLGKGKYRAQFNLAILGE